MIPLLPLRPPRPLTPLLPLRPRMPLLLLPRLPLPLPLLPHGSGVALGWLWIRGALDRVHEAGAMNKGRGLGERWAGLLRLIDFC